MNAGDCLRASAHLFDCKNAEYKSNYRMVGPLLEILFPEGVTKEQLGRPEFHLLMLKLIKLSRFVVMDMKHLDSIQDDCVYSAMIEKEVMERLGLLDEEEGEGYPEGACVAENGSGTTWTQEVRVGEEEEVSYDDEEEEEWYNSQVGEYGLAHEVWAAAQLLPQEGIADGVARIHSLLKSNFDYLGEPK